jgi:threonine/homoserine/homoserine lactone efflux protein
MDCQGSGAATILRMIPTANLFAFGLASIPLIVIPGQSVLFTIGRSLSLGKVGGLLTVLGNSLGALVITAAIAVGLGAVVESSVVVFTIVKLLGAGYIVFLGVQAIRHRNQKADAALAATPGGGHARTLWEGFVVGVSNVKTMIFLIAVFPLFVDHSVGGVPAQILALGAVFIAIALVSDSVWALVAGAARDWFARSPRRIATLGAIGGVIMIGIGVAVLLIGHGG